MGIINPLDKVWQNLLGLIVVGLVFFWIYKNMQDTPVKRWITENIEKIKEMVKGDGQD